MNSPLKSKINWTSLAIALIGIAVYFDWVPAEIEKQVIDVTLIGGPALIAVWRTYFTGPKE